MDSVLLESSPFHNPRLCLSEKNKEGKINELLKEFVLEERKVKKVVEIFREEMSLGLMANPPRKSVFYMGNTFVTDIPDGTEEGDFLAMDLGTTNLRIHSIRLKPGSQPEIKSKAYEIEMKYRTGTSEQLFAYLTNCLEDFINKNPELKGKRLPFGFTFSYGYQQKALDSGIIQFLSNLSDLQEVIGKDVVQYFRSAIAKKGLNIDVMAVLNDTTSTLAYGQYLKPDTQIAFVWGTGTNTCYLESVERIENFDSLKTFGKKVDKIVINCENGFLGDNGSIDFAKSKWDKEIDQEFQLPNDYWLPSFEKLIGGLFFGELLRRVLLSLAENKLLVNGLITDKLKDKHLLNGSDVSSVESDSNSGAVIALLHKLGYSTEQISSDDIAVVKYVCAIISVRNALLAAADISAVALHIGKPIVRVAMDGSVYKKHPKMHTLTADFINKLVPNQTVEIFLANDGSGIGSAFVAAVAHKLKQKS